MGAGRCAEVGAEAGDEASAGALSFVWAGAGPFLFSFSMLVCMGRTGRGVTDGCLHPDYSSPRLGEYPAVSAPRSLLEFPAEVGARNGWWERGGVGGRGGGTVGGSGGGKVVFGGGGSAGRRVGAGRLVGEDVGAEADGWWERGREVWWERRWERGTVGGRGKGGGHVGGHPKMSSYFGSRDRDGEGEGGGREL